MLTTPQSEMSEEDRYNVNAMNTDLDGANSLPSIADFGPSPGDKGFDISHEEGDHEVFEDLAEGVAGLTGLSVTLPAEQVM